MRVGLIGLGRMGAGLARRLARGGHECAVYDRDPAAADALAAGGARAAASLVELAAALPAPRVVWIMVPAGAVGGVLEELAPLLSAGDVVVDGGNTHYKDDLERARTLAARGVQLVDCGTSGGLAGEERGYCLMLGGDEAAIARLDPVLRALADGERGYARCGPAGAGHFAKMVHNGIEYGLMAAYAEGLDLLKHAPGFTLDAARIAEVWRHGSVISSWLLDLAAEALAKDPELEAFSGRVADSGEGRWTALAAIEQGVPAPVLAAALFGRFRSQGGGAFGDRVLSAMRLGFGGHRETPAAGT